MKKRVYSSVLIASSNKKKTGIRKVIRVICVGDQLKKDLSLTSKIINHHATN